MDSTTLRAGDADRERTARFLHDALRDGRLDLTEYDERLTAALTARTYAELDVLVADLPGAVPASLIPFADPARPFPAGSPRGAVVAWVRAQWDGWLITTALLVALWFAARAGGASGFFWPMFILVPWGGRLLLSTVRGIRQGEPQRWATRKAMKAAKKARKAARKAAAQP